MNSGSAVYRTVRTVLWEVSRPTNGRDPTRLIRSLSESVIIPIAGVILAFVMTYELIQMVIDRNNLHDDVC